MSELTLSSKALARTIEQAAYDIRTAMQQCKKSNHLAGRIDKAAVKAANAFLEFDAEHGGNITGFAGMFADADGQLNDDQLLGLWSTVITSYSRQINPCKSGNAGASDFPSFKLDEQGELLVGPDGRPRRVTEDYDEEDQLEHNRRQASDWADVCDILVVVIRQEQSKPNSRNPKSLGGSPEIVAQSNSGSVRLYGRDDKVRVNGNWKEPLTTDQQYATVKALLDAGENGLNKDGLVKESGVGDARGVMKRLCEKDADWAAVYKPGIKKGGRYKII